MADTGKRRSVFISNIPPSSSAPELETFLLQELESMDQDRGHLLTVLFPVSSSNPRLALATFQNEKAMVALMRRRLYFGGEHLTMQPFLSEVFSSMTAVINPDVTELFPFNSLDFSRLLEKRSGVECRQLEERDRDRLMAQSACSPSQDMYILTGSWYQLQNARKFMQERVVDEANRTGMMDRGPRAQDMRTSDGTSAASHESTPQHSIGGHQDSVRSTVTGDRDGIGLPGIPASGGTLERPSADPGVGSSVTEQRRNENKIDTVHREEPSESSPPTAQNMEEVRSNENGPQTFLSDRDAVNGATVFGNAHLKEHAASATEESRTNENRPTSPFLSDREALNEATMYGNAHLKECAVSANQRGTSDSKRSGGEVTSSRTVGAAPFSYKSPLVSDDELSVGSSVDYMKHVRVPQSSLTSSSESQTYKPPGDDDTQNVGQMRDRGCEDAVSPRSDQHTDSAESVPSSSTRTDHRVLASVSEEPAESLGSLPVDPGVFSYILLKQSDSIRGMEEKYGVKFSMHVAEDTDDTDVESALLKITPTVETAEIVQAHDEFVEFYSDVFSILKHRVIAVEGRAIDLDSLDKTVELVHNYYRTVLITVSPKRVLVYGPDESDVRLAKAWIVEALQETPVDRLTQRGQSRIQSGKGVPAVTSRSTHPNPGQPLPDVGRREAEPSLIRGGHVHLPEEQRSEAFPQAHTRPRDEVKPSSVNELGQSSAADIIQRTQLNGHGLMRHSTSDMRMNEPFTRIEDEPVDYQHQRGLEGASNMKADVVAPSSDDESKVSGGGDGTISPPDRPNHLGGARGTDDVIPVDPGVFAFIQSQKHTILCNIEQNYGIKLNVKGTLESDVYMVEVVPQGVASERTTQKGKEAFVNFYSEVFSRLDHRAISLGDFESISQEALDEIMLEIEHLFSDVLFRVVGSRVLIYGQGRHNVDSARDMVLDRLRRRSMLSLTDPALEHEDDMSIASLGSDTLLSRLNHLRYGSLSPDGPRGQISGLTLSADSPAVKRESPSVDQSIQDLGRTEEVDLGHHLPSPVGGRMPNVSHEQPVSFLLNGSTEAPEVPSKSLPNSVRHATDAIPSYHSDVVTDAAQHDKIHNRNVRDGTYRFQYDRLIIDLTSGIRVQVYLKDITTMRVDAIVNAANETLSNGSGVAGAIRRAGGEVMQADCNRHIAHHGLVYPAKVVHTGAGNLPCRFVLHAVGPRWLDYPDKQQCRQTLKTTVLKCLVQADEKLQVKSLAMPFISSGIFRVPFEICIEEICEALLDLNKRRLSASQGNLEEIHLVDVDRNNISEAQDIMLRTLHLEAEGAKVESDEVDVAENLSELRQGRNGGFDNLEREEPLFADDDEVSERSRGHIPRGGSAVATRSQRRKSSSSDEDMPHEKARRGRTGRKTSGRPAMVRSSSLPYLPRDDSKDVGRTSWTSGMPAPPRRDQKRVGNTAPGKKPIHAWEKVQEPVDVSRVELSSAPKETRQEQKVRELLDAYSRAPPSPELSRKTEFEINRILTEQDRGAREKQPKPKKRSQSLDRRPREKCFVCFSTRNLSKRKFCEHFICETCKLARLDVGRCRECKKHPEKKCDLCSDQHYLLNCRGCDKSLCIYCIRKGLDRCADCMDQMRPPPERQKEKRQPKLREPIIGTRSSRIDTKKVYRIKSGSSATDHTGTRRKPMLGLNQPLDVAGQAYSSTAGMNGSAASKSGPIHQAFSKEFVTEEAPHEDILRRLNREQEARPQISSKVDNHTSPLGYSQTTHRHSRKRASKEGKLEVVGQGSAAALKQEQATCVICMDLIKNPRALSKCKHTFCSGCIETSLKFKPVCPICGESYGQLRGNQPDGDMNYTTVSSDLPGYPGCGTIVIVYRILDGIQSSEHPNPGELYQGTHREAYLPNNREGQEVLRLLKRAFEARLVFTIGRSVTTGLDNMVVWNDIHHKTRQTGGSELHGYPDPGYLQRVRDELEAKGIK